MQNPVNMHQGKCLYICRTLFIKKSGIWRKLGILEETKDVTEWGEKLLSSWRRRLQLIPARFQPTPTIKDTLYEQEIKDLLGS